jgi:hypothetical protein
MGRISKESYNWAAGSYVDLFIISAVTQVLFVIGLYWTFMGDTSWSNEFPPHSAPISTNLKIPILALGTLPILGWLMALALGIGFDRYPLDYKTAPFDPSLISTIAALNIAGQVLIIAGILTSHIEALKNLSQMGAALLGMQLILVGPLVWKLTKARPEKNKVGMWSVGSLLSLPIIGVITILTWSLVDHNLFYVLFWTVLLDGFWLMLTFALILSHFQDRLGWELIDSKFSNQAFAVFVILIITHIMLQILYQTEVITDNLVKASISAPILWVFFVSRPDRIWKNVLSGKKCSAQILSAHTWLLVTAAMGIYEALYIQEMLSGGMFYTRFMLLFGIVVQAVWGFSVYLHDDHKYIDIEDRKNRFVSVIMMMLLMACIIYLALNTGGHIDLFNSKTVTLIAVIALFIASFEFLLWLVRDAIFNHNEWHRIPMHYSNMDNNGRLNDAYFPNESE